MAFLRSRLMPSVRSLHDLAWMYRGSNQRTNSGCLIGTPLHLAANRKKYAFYSLKAAYLSVLFSKYLMASPDSTSNNDAHRYGAFSFVVA